ncbi:MAG TPA: TetR/AcrR family transcriptional regulator, partial [Lachnoclostridium phytofermentans]|nr:TetR/AcrR family transcriptional regulator [Lachnoclostridium phytofermentans]
NLIFTTFTSMLLQRQEHCKALLEMVSRCIY